MEAGVGPEPGERLASPVVALVTLVTLGTGFGCSYDYRALMGPDEMSDGGTASGGRGGSGGSDGSGGIGQGGTGGRGTVGTGGAGSGGSAAGSGGTPPATGGAPSSGGATASGGATGAGGVTGVGGSATGGGGPTGGAAGTSGGGTGGGAPGGASSGGASSGGAGGGSAGGTAGTAGGGGAASDPDLVLWYKFDEAMGTDVADSATVAGAHPGMLATFGVGGDATFSSVHQVGTRALALTANGATAGGYVVLPSLSELAPSAITLAIWVQVATAQRWQRVFDLGNSTATNMALTTQDGTDSVRFVIRVQGGPGEQLINTTSKLTLSVWHHLAVVLREGVPYTGELYIDGVLAGSNAAMTLHAGDLGATVNNFLGRSQFTADPYWSGSFDDFRVYRRALTGAEVAALMLQR